MYDVLDISKWQGSYNAEVAKAQGINTVILRAAYATTKDTKFDAFYASAKAARQTVGAYGFATWHYRSKNGGNVNTARAQMIQQTNAWIAICKDKLDGYFAIDQELETGTFMGLTPAENEILLNECIALLEGAGFVVCVYCSVSWAMAQFNKNNINADLWLAYYYADPYDPDFDAVANYQTAQGQYFAYMRSCGDQLVGWQFGRIGYGPKYGVDSASVDRNLFYQTAKTVLEYFSPGAVRVKCGFMTPGDLATIGALLTRLAIPYTSKDGYIITDIPITKGDQNALIKACAALEVGCVVYTEETVAEYLMIGFASAGDIATFEALLAELQIPFATDDGFILTLIPVTGSSKNILQIVCNALIVPCVSVTL